MANIEFKGFVQKHEGNRPWEIAENHSVKDGDSWKTTARTFHKVWLPQDAASLDEGDLVEISGTQKTVPSEYKGEKRYNLIVYADSVQIVKAANRALVGVSGGDQWTGGANDADLTPF